MDVSACYEYFPNLFRYLSFPIEKYMPRKFQLMLLKTFSVPISWHHITYWVFWWCVLCPIPIERWWKRYHSVYFLSQTLVKWKQVSFHFIFIWWAQTLRNFPTLWHIILKLRLIVDMIIKLTSFSFLSVSGYQVLRSPTREMVLLRDPSHLLPPISAAKHCHRNFPSQQK